MLCTHLFWSVLMTTMKVSGCRALKHWWHMLSKLLCVYEYFVHCCISQYVWVMVWVPFWLLWHQSIGQHFETVKDKPLCSSFITKVVTVVTCGAYNPQGQAKMELLLFACICFLHLMAYSKCIWCGHENWMSNFAGKEQYPQVSVAYHVALTLLPMRRML